MPLIRSRASWNDLVSAPSVQAPLGPVCLLCGRVVDSEELVEGYPGQTTHARVLVKHHGAEELGSFDMGSTNWDEQDLASMMRRRNWFSPFEQAGLGRGILIKNPGEHDDVDTPNRVFSLPSAPEEK